MKTETIIIDLAKEKGMIRTADVVQKTGMTRQGACKALRKLVHEGLLVKVGSTRGAGYLLAGKQQGLMNGALQERPITHLFKIQGLDEDRVFSAIANEANMRQELSASALNIATYAFTEMVNNAIDH